MYNRNVESYFVYGFHTTSSVMRFQPNRCKKLFIARKSDHDSIIAIAQQNRIPHEVVERTWLENKFRVGSDAQGIVLQCKPFPYCDVEDLFSSKKPILVLDSWQDAANIGRAARAAICFGAAGMVIGKDRAAEVNAAAEKSAVGALAQIPVARVVNLAAAIKKIKEANYFVYGADERGDAEIGQIDFADRVAFVIGREGAGLRDLIKKSCDFLVRIPMAQSDVCLNAADTSLVLLYELSRKKVY